MLADGQDDRALVAVLERSRALGFLGPGPVEQHVLHARSFVRAVEELVGPVGEATGGADGRSLRCLDLGTGGGVPGLVLAGLLPSSEWLLLDSMQRRTTVLADEVTDLGWEDRVQVHCARAEAAAREPELRGSFDLVTARSFAAPAVTAECARGFLRPDGLLVVSDPPSGAGDRWPIEPLGGLAFHLVGHAVGCTVLRAVGPVPRDVPRPVGKPGKRPRF